MFYQVVSEVLSLVISLVQGYSYSSMETRMRSRAWAGTRQSIKTRVTLECEKEHQEHLLLSVMPAYIAAEVSAAPSGGEQQNLLHFSHPLLTKYSVQIL